MLVILKCYVWLWGNVSWLKDVSRDQILQSVRNLSRSWAPGHNWISVSRHYIWNYDWFLSLFLRLLFRKAPRLKRLEASLMILLSDSGTQLFFLQNNKYLTLKNSLKRVESNFVSKTSARNFCSSLDTNVLSFCEFFCVFFHSSPPSLSLSLSLTHTLPHIHNRLTSRRKNHSTPMLVGVPHKNQMRSPQTFKAALKSSTGMQCSRETIRSQIKIDGVFFSSRKEPVLCREIHQIQVTWNSIKANAFFMTCIYQLRECSPRPKQLGMQLSCFRFEVVTLLLPMLQWMSSPFWMATGTLSTSFKEICLLTERCSVDKVSILKTAVGGHHGPEVQQLLDRKQHQAGGQSAVECLETFAKDSLLLNKDFYVLPALLLTK